ncbi:MAG: pyridoxal phosphate-dependent aminotransferase [Candidatus Hodarchaeota archaeon]
MKLSALTKRLKPSATLSINEQIVKKREKGEYVLHMGFGESPFPVHPIFRNALSKNADKKSYQPTQGILPLRERISAFYKTIFNLRYSPDQIIVAPGSKALLLDALMALDGPLFLPAPSWVSYQHQARFSGKEVYHLQTLPENSYRLTPDTLEKTVSQYVPDRQKQKILLLNYPCNPTGHSFSAAQLKDLASVARDLNIIILSDEIYALISYQGQKHHSVAEFYPEGTLVTGGLSKDRSLGGFRLGVMLLPEGEKALLRAVLSIGSESWSCAAAPIQYAALEAYKTSPEIVNFIKDCTAIHEIITRYVHRRIEEIDIRCPPPQGAFYLFPDWNEYQETLVKKGIISSNDLATTLIKEWNVATLPGSEFGMAPDNLCIRIATVDYDGAATLKKFLENRKDVENDPELFIHSVAPRIVEACNQFEKFTDSIRT